LKGEEKKRGNLLLAEEDKISLPFRGRGGWGWID
jgi:hypothetical protein